VSSPTPSVADVVLVGGGGHAAVCLDLLRAQDRSVLGYTGPAATDIDLTYLGTDEEILTNAEGSIEVLVVVGDNRTRLLLLRRLVSFGFTPATAVHPNAVVSPSSSVGPGSVVMAGAVVNARTSIGIGAILNTGTTVDHDCRIADGVHLAPGTHLAGGVTIEEGTFLGVGVSVIPNCLIGPWALVGAGAAVISDLAGGETYVGVPAGPVQRSR
jgi:UDP-perosamine 4-acetyltransferase